MPSLAVEGVRGTVHRGALKREAHMPGEAARGFLEVQDAYLQEETAVGSYCKFNRCAV